MLTYVLIFHHVMLACGDFSPPTFADSHILPACVSASLPIMLTYVYNPRPTAFFCAFSHIEDASHTRSSFYRNLAYLLYDIFSL